MGKKATREIAEIDLGVLKEVVGFRIRRIQNYLSRSFAAHVCATMPEFQPGLFSSLALISANAGISQTALARELGFDKATVVALLDSLEKVGWAERKRSTEDRRRHALQITSKGKKALQQLRKAAIDNEVRVHAALSKAEHAQLFALLDKVYAACFAAAAD